MREGVVRAHQDGCSGVHEEYSSDRAGDGHTRKTIRKVLASWEPKYRQEARPGLPGAGEM
ncbi:hypothetical protein [Candidatus Methylomirabilis limnetica]|uniref:hypothetical protein n=1 Tax=Candidatus Methylomirabilis limnetica TaxID=2033718 RepID=UPI001379C29F|nr:hypothetical protein [Candidatus Methylomirabilis limnetica]